MLVAGVDSSTQSTKVLLCQADDGTIVGQASAPPPEEVIAGVLSTTFSHRKSECRHRPGISPGETVFRPDVWLKTL